MCAIHYSPYLTKDHIIAHNERQIILITTLPSRVSLGDKRPFNQIVTSDLNLDSNIVVPLTFQFQFQHSLSITIQILIKHGRSIYVELTMSWISPSYHLVT